MPFGTGAKLHKTLPDVSTPHVLADLEAGVASEAEVDARLGLNRVKLPSPGTGDYITPSEFAASSYYFFHPVLVLRRHGVINEGNIDDGNLTTSANPGVDLAAGENREAIVWDFGSIATRTIDFRHLTNSGAARSFIETSEDDITWGTQSEAVNALRSGSFTASFRYIRWRARNIGTSAWPGSGWRLYHLAPLSDPDTVSTRDDNLVTKWRPDPPNELNAWCRWDMGAPKICSGCRIYWGADTAYHPSAYRIETSEDGATWTTVVTETVAPPASAWKEYSWPARYARFIRLIVDTHGSLGTEIFEFDYYSRIVERVASEHGHGSGVVPHLRVEYSDGHPPMRFGDTLRERVREASAKAKGRPRLSSLLELIEARGELIEFLNRD